MLMIALFFASAVVADEVEHADDAAVYHAQGSKRVHVDGCPRLPSTEGMTKLTLAEARAKGLPLCTRCPGTTTPRKVAAANAKSDAQHGETPPTQAPILLWPKDPKRNSPDGLGAMVKRDDGKTQVTDIKTPHLIPYLVKDVGEPRPAVILCPGGGYKKLVTSLHWPIAEWLNEQGVHAFVLMYRCPSNRSGEAMPDLQRAIRMVRSKANDWQIDPDKVGVLGTSAGGNLCARASVGFGIDKHKAADAMDKLSARPDFTVLLYPAYIAKRGTQTPSDWVQVPADAPPTLLFAAKDDKGHFANSPAYEAALKQAGVPVESHYYKTGGHGFGLNHPATGDWADRLLKWLSDQGVIEHAGADAE